MPDDTAAQGRPESGEALGHVLWFIPTHGDGRYLGTPIGARPVMLDYMSQIARAADSLGYFGVLLPTGASWEDSWVIASALAPQTRELCYLVAVRPGLQQPAQAARMAATLDRISDGRLLINVVTGGDPVELRAEGVGLEHDERYQVTDEFLAIWRGLMAGETVSHQGRHLMIDKGQLHFPSVQSPYPPRYFGGSSAAGQRVAAEHVDVYLTWGQPPADVGEKISRMRALAAERGRSLLFGIRLHVIVRDTEAEAWRDADALIQYLEDDVIAAAQKRLAQMDSASQQHMARLHRGSRARLQVSPNLWAGVGLVRGGAGTVLVGDPHQVAERMREHMALGIDRFILSGYPHLEECYRFAELGIPALAAAGDHGDPQRRGVQWRSVRRTGRQLHPARVACRGPAGPMPDAACTARGC